MTRRGLLQGILAAGVWNGVFGRAGAAQPASMKAVEDLQKNWKLLLAEGTKIPLPSEPLKLSNDEWRKRLDKAAYHVLREEGTERAGTSPLNNEKRPGIFACAGCGLPLFTSDMKYESGTGWPSFWAPLEGSVDTSADRSYGMTRTEVHCAACGGHLGHVFPDGPMAQAAMTDVTQGAAAAHLLLDAPAARRPTAIVAQSDLLAMGVVRAAQDLGLSVPGDLSVTGFDGIELPWFPGTLTTVLQHGEEKGRRLGTLLRQALAGEVPDDAEMPTEVRLGTTTAPPPR